jgi:hypothetical protein
MDTSLRLLPVGIETRNLQTVRSEAPVAPREREEARTLAPTPQTPAPSTQVNISDAARNAARADTPTLARPEAVAAGSAGPATPVREPEQVSRLDTTRSNRVDAPDSGTVAGQDAARRYLENANLPSGQAGPSTVRVAA